MAHTRKDERPFRLLAWKATTKICTWNISNVYRTFLFNSTKVAAETENYQMDTFRLGQRGRASEEKTLYCAQGSKKRMASPNICIHRILEYPECWQLRHRSTRITVLQTRDGSRSIGPIKKATWSDKESISYIALNQLLPFRVVAWEKKQSRS